MRHSWRSDLIRGPDFFAAHDRTRSALRGTAQRAPDRGHFPRCRAGYALGLRLAANQRHRSLVGADRRALGALSPSGRRAGDGSHPRERQRAVGGGRHRRLVPWRRSRALERIRQAADVRFLAREPARAWTVAGLAQQAGVSRSVFAARFTHLLEEAPLAYLGRWRIQLAARLLETTDDSVLQIALKVGYESEAAFNRAFRREFELPPARYRRERLRGVIST